MVNSPEERQCVAIIPARGGSKGVPRKNVRLVGGVPLVARSILAARASERIDAVYVSTDDPEIAETALRYGAEVIDRPKELSGDKASSEAALLHGLDVLQARGEQPDILVFLQCTSPLTTPEAIDAVVSGIDDPRYAMAFSVVEDHGFLWGLNEQGEGVGINHDASLPRLRRQELPPRFRETGAIYALRVHHFKEKKNRFCGAAKPVQVNMPGLEIDSLDDLHMAEALLQAKQPGFQQQPPPPGIKVLVTDFDGVHTDDCVYIDENGRESVRCSRADGMGIEMLRKAGIQVLILSKEVNPVVSARARKLQVEVIQGCENKRDALLHWLSIKKIETNQMSYVGNDINDAECLDISVWGCCPHDAHISILNKAKYVAHSQGGKGVIREIAELITPLMSKTCSVKTS